MAKIAYNNGKNINSGLTSFESNYGYYLKVYFRKDTIPCLKSKSANKLLTELQKLIIVSCKNIHHVQKFQK